MSLRVKFWLIIVLAVVTAVLAYPKEGQLLQKIGLKNAHLSVKQGLDLQGGAELVFQANGGELKKLSKTEQETAMSSLINVIQKRANPSGTAEVTVQRQGSDRVIVDLPGVTNVDEAINQIGRTANLQFLEMAPGSNMPLPTGLTGKDVSRADPDFDAPSGRPIVTLKMKGGDSTKKFGELTTRINKQNGQLITMLDNEIVFGPATVSQPITDGSAQLSGNFKDIEAARSIAQQINAGALPIPIDLVQQRSVGPSLGAESIARSLLAGIVGLVVVAIFMVAYYRAAGLLAVLALIIYTLITLTIYKLTALT
ncbi:MAG TPA: hypothetical protein VMR98_02170, partial [Candidatus Polarisedimenticolaceae bacterium]|nr:hypothetical protein [Candidatus Polarisedimenticolaceae bacterium]